MKAEPGTFRIEQAEDGRITFSVSVYDESQSKVISMGQSFKPINGTIGKKGFFGNIHNLIDEVQSWFESMEIDTEDFVYDRAQ